MAKQAKATTDREKPPVIRITFYTGATLISIDKAYKDDIAEDLRSAIEAFLNTV